MENKKLNYKEMREIAIKKIEDSLFDYHIAQPGFNADYQSGGAMGSIHLAYKLNLITKDEYDHYNERNVEGKPTIEELDRKISELKDDTIKMQYMANEALDENNIDLKEFIDKSIAICEKNISKYQAMREQLMNENGGNK